jgi:hypothetical protein
MNYTPQILAAFFAGATLGVIGRYLRRALNL